MKKNILNFILLCIVVFSSCRDELVVNDNPTGKATLNLKTAKSYFEKNATGLNSLAFGPQGKSRTLENNAPQWSEAEVIATGQSIVVEVPIYSGNSTRIYKSEMVNGKRVGKNSLVFKKLIVSQRDNGHMDMFIVTFVPECFTPRFAHNLKMNTRYFGGTFSGLLFCSDLEGNFQNCFKYRDGVNLGVVRIAFKSDLEKAGVQFDKDDVFLLFGSTVMSRSFGNDESWDLGVCVHQLNPETCPACNELTVVPNHCPGGCGKDLDWTSCTCCWDCRKTPCECPKCEECKISIYSCRCAVCSVCGRKPCVNICSWCDERYCHGQCHQQPEQPGGGGPGEEPVIPVVSVSLSLNPSTVTLAKSFQMNVDVRPSGVRVNSIEYEVQTKDGKWQTIETLFSGNSRTVYATQPGIWNYRVTVEHEYGVNSTPINVLTVQYPTIGEIIGNNEVKSLLDDLWNRTINAATTTHCCEFGTGIYLNTYENGDSFYSVDYKQGEFYEYDAPEFKVHYEISESIPHDPRNGGKFAVAIFHTHPSFLKASPGEIHERPVGPSQLDKNGVTIYPEIVYDYTGNYSLEYKTKIHTNRDRTGLEKELCTFGVLPRREL